MPDGRATEDASRRALDIVGYREDTGTALNVYYVAADAPKFLLMSRPEIRAELSGHVRELDFTCSLSVLASLEAALKADFETRCRRRGREPISREFRRLYRQRNRSIANVSFDDDILEVWKRFYPEFGSLIGQLRGAWRFRNWLAHGRYGDPPGARRYGFEDVFLIYDTIVSTFPFVRPTS